MISIIFTVIILYLLFSITTILTTVTFIEPIDSKKISNEALFLGIFIAIIAQLILIFFASFLLKFGNLIYILSGILLLYLGTKGLLKHKKKLYRKILFPHRHVGHLIFKISLINITLSLDNIVAVIGVTQNIDYISSSLLIAIFLLFLLITFVRDYLHHLKGLEEAAFISMLFLGFKFIAIPFSVNVSNTITSLVVLIICAVILFYYNQGNFKYVWMMFRRNIRRKKYIN